LGGASVSGLREMAGAVSAGTARRFNLGASKSSSYRAVPTRRAAVAPRRDTLQIGGAIILHIEATEFSLATCATERQRKSKSDNANDLRMCDKLGVRAGKSAFCNEPCRLNQR